MLLLLEQEPERKFHTGALGGLPVSHRRRAAWGKTWGPREGGHQGLELSPSVHSAPSTHDT